MWPKIRAIPSHCLQIIRSLPLTNWLMIMGVCLFIWFWVFGHNGLVDMENLIRLKRNYEIQKIQLAEEKGKLEQELKNLDDPRYIKHLLHQELGFVAPDEVVIQFQKKKKN